MVTNPFGRAIWDCYRGVQSQPLLERDGNTIEEHPVEEYYFRIYPSDVSSSMANWLAQWIEGPLLDMGAGTGNHALYFQTQFTTVAIEIDPYLLDILHDRGISNVRCVDMFSLREEFNPNQFSSALGLGTQMGLVRSRHGLQDFFNTLDYVIKDGGTVILDCYDPTIATCSSLVGFRSDPEPGLGFRVLAFEYDDEYGSPLLFRLFSPSVIEHVVTETVWQVADVWRPDDSSDPYYRIALTKATGPQ